MKVQTWNQAQMNHFQKPPDPVELFFLLVVTHRASSPPHTARQRMLRTAVINGDDSRSEIRSVLPAQAEQIRLTRSWSVASPHQGRRGDCWQSGGLIKTNAILINGRCRSLPTKCSYFVSCLFVIVKNMPTSCFCLLIGNKAHKIQRFAAALMRHPAEEEKPSVRNTA